MNKSNRQKKTIVFLLPLIVIAIVAVALATHRKAAVYQKDSGMVFGTLYNITYQYDRDLRNEIEEALKEVDMSLSMFNKSSVITKVNNNESVELDKHFLTVYRISEKVNKTTEGAFDITVAPLVNAWGFGFKHGQFPTEATIDSIMEITGMDKVRLVGKEGELHVEKTDERIMLDCGAVAKGYGVDVVADLLRSKGISNFLVEIGGEIVASGVNSRNNSWNIGIETPTDDSLNTAGTAPQTVIPFTDKALATSGNYRNFYYRDGKKYAHTINPKTGYPVQHSLLSATVVAADCATADAFATSFMVVGLEKAQQILAQHPELKAYLIYSDADGELKVWQSAHFGE